MALNLSPIFLLASSRRKQESLLHFTTPNAEPVSPFVPRGGEEHITSGDDDDVPRRMLSCLIFNSTRQCTHEPFVCPIEKRNAAAVLSVTILVSAWFVGNMWPL